MTPAEEPGAADDESEHDKVIKASRATGERTIQVALAEIKILRKNVYVQRKMRTLKEEEVQVCSCRPPSSPDQWGCLEDCVNRAVLIECLPGFCPCGDQCANQRIQRGVMPETEIVDCGRKGLGLVTHQLIKTGEFVGEYLGEIVTEQEYHMRRLLYHNEKHRYMMVLSGGEVIDATRMGGIARFINHSCDPNCGVEKWEVNGEERCGIFARRTIVPGEELNFDYKFESFSKLEITECLCGAPHCRQVIGANNRVTRPPNKPPLATPAGPEKPKVLDPIMPGLKSRLGRKAADALLERMGKCLSSTHRLLTKKEVVRVRSARVLLHRNLRKHQESNFELLFLEPYFLANTQGDVLNESVPPKLRLRELVGFLQKPPLLPKDQKTARLNMLTQRLTPERFASGLKPEPGESDSVSVMVLVDVAAEQALELAQTLKFSHQQRPRRADEEALALAAEAKGVAAVGARECNVLHGCQCHPTPAESREFRKRWLLLTEHERTVSLRADFHQFLQTANDLLPCLGCRNSTETLLQKLLDGAAQSPPLVVRSGLTFDKKDRHVRLNSMYMNNPDASLSLFLHHERWGSAALGKLSSRTGSKAGSRARCPLHSQRARGRPRPAAFEALWHKLPDEHKRHLAHIDSDQFLSDLEGYLRRHRFCCRCKEKVLEAYDLLIGSSCSEDDCEDCAGFDCADKHSDYGDDLHYTSYLFDELTYSRATSHIVVPCHLEFMTQLMARADQEIVGDWGDRHARTIAEAQDEVLICLGMVIWEKMQTLWTQSRSEKRSEELLVHFAVSTLRRNFDVAVEALHGKEMMEQLLAEEDDESRRLAKKKEKKKEKKKKRKTATKQKQIDRTVSEPTKSPKRLEPKSPMTPGSSTQSTSSSSLDEDPSNQSQSDSTNEDEVFVHQSPHRCSSECEAECSFKNLTLDERMEQQLLSSMGWDASNQFGLSLPELDDDEDDGIPEDEIAFWKQNRSTMVSKRLAQRQKLQEKFDLFVRTNSSS